eukprot:NODE_1015_length_1761_cov_29.888435_g896_i0.p1 GENE.NODE_1015_length_1761_cov_29.888435_g896_i0~~NODE_1015_length_1761_cov_29.888435_g896_i0.p1  ORF type:complete len:546 (-),score=106.42 NODE_1015_length_1761_cov_29.888435_g896_i0:69-1706(-)
MGSFFSKDSLFGRDIDDIFSYKSSKQVVFRDRRLCCAQMLGILGIFFYVVVYEVILQQGYLLRDQPYQIARLSIRNPQEYSPALPPYCSSNVNGSRKYSSEPWAWSLPCLQWDYHDAVVPPAEETSVFLTTRATITTQETADLECAENWAACAGPITTNRTSYYTFEPERFTLLVQHVIYGDSNTVIKREREAKGAIDDASGNSVYTFPTTRFGDVLSIGEWLRYTQAAPYFVPPVTNQSESVPLPDSSVILDQASAQYPNESRRYSGTTILFVVDYSTRRSSLSGLKYSYRLLELPIEYKYEEVIVRPLNGGGMLRKIINRHGVRIHMLGAGYVGRFDFQQLLITLVTGLALAKFASVLVDLVVFRLLPLKAIYAAYRTTVTVDFSQVHKIDDDEFLVFFEEPFPGGSLRLSKNELWRLTDEAEKARLQQQVCEERAKRQQQQQENQPQPQPQPQPQQQQQQQPPSWDQLQWRQQPYLQPYRPQETREYPYQQCLRPVDQQPQPQPQQQPQAGLAQATAAGEPNQYWSSVQPGGSAPPDNHIDL